VRSERETGEKDEKGNFSIHSNVDRRRLAWRAESTQSYRYGSTLGSDGSRHAFGAGHAHRNENTGGRKFDYTQSMFGGSSRKKG
jgi:hypothetical protein